MSLSLLPNGKQQFTDENGKPLADGQVFFYVPNTSPPQFADTWQDINGITKNANPITLDGAGRCVAWGTGIYRQVVYDLNGVLIWDQLTSVVGESSSTTLVTYYSVFMEGKPSAAELFPILTVPANWTLPAGLSGSVFSILSSSLPTGAILLTLQKNGLSIGTISVSTSGVFTVSFPNDVSFATNDTFSVLWPSSQDATAGNISLTFLFEL